jgi:PAS domain S-box-containing protein
MSTVDHLKNWLQANYFMPEEKHRFAFRDFLLLKQIHRIQPVVLFALLYMFFLLFSSIPQTVNLDSDVRIYLMGIVAVIYVLIIVLLLLFSFFEFPGNASELELKHHVLFYFGVSSLVVIVALLHWFSPYIRFLYSPFTVAVVILFIAVPLTPGISLFFIFVTIIMAVSGLPMLSWDALSNYQIINALGVLFFTWIVSRLSYRELIFAFVENADNQTRLAKLDEELKQSRLREQTQSKTKGHIEKQLGLQIEENTRLKENLKYETTERNQELRQWFENQQQELRLLLDSADTALALVDKEFKIKRFNRAFENWVKGLGGRYLHPELNFLQIVPKSNRDEWQDIFQGALHSKSVTNITEMTGSEGKTIYITNIAAMESFTHKGENFYTICLRDNTENHYKNKLLQAITELSATVNSAMDLNELCADVHQIIKKLIPANNFYIALYNDVRDVLSFPYVVDKYDTGGKVEHYDYWKPSRGITEYTFRRQKPLILQKGELEDLIKSGEVELIGQLPLYWIGIPLKDHNETVFGVMVAQSYDDEEPYTEKDLELAVYISQQVGPAIQRFKNMELFQSLIQHVNEGILIIQEKQLVFYNQRFAELLGYSLDELRYLDIKDIYTAEGYEILEKRNMLLANGETPEAHYETAFRKKDGAIFHAEVNSSFITFLGIEGMFELVRSMEERLEREKTQQYLNTQLRQKEKMDSIGLLAGGVAHEINNPLTGMINYAQLIESLSEDNQLQGFASEIIKQGERVATVVKNLLNFSQQETKEMVPSLVENLIDSSLSLIQTLLQNDQIQVEVLAEADLPKIICNEQQLVQVFINILLNSKDALNKKYEGYHPDKQIKISLKNHPETERISIAFWDNGVGIPENIRQRIFDPFYTTKSFGQGTGLGLSAAYGIIKEHNGAVEIDSAPGQYTRFVLYLPYDPKKNKKAKEDNESHFND